MQASNEKLQEFSAMALHATQGDEIAILRAGLHLPKGIAADRQAQLERLLRFGAVHDAAILFHRLWLPDHGFQFGAPPPRTGKTNVKAVAFCWQSGSRAAMPYRATTPALALLAAASGEAARLRDESRRAGCGICHGLGWYLSQDNQKQICRRCRD